MLHLGIDLGGTKTELIALNAQGRELYRERRPTPQGDYAATVANIVAMVRDAEVSLGEQGTLGLGIPGALSRRTGRVKNANSTWLIGEDLQGDLERDLARPVRIENDANCFALSEATDGGGAGAESVFGVIIGTGCGGGLVYRGQIITGINAIGGEWGHNPLPWAALEDEPMPCYCGQQGCIETFLSGPGMARHFERTSGQALTAKEIAARARQGDAPAQAHLERYATWLAKGLASVINVFDPAVIVLGGGLSNIPMLYARVPQLWARWVFSDSVETRLVPPQYGDSSGVRGAAWLGAASEGGKD
ncbi:N-acetylglucosamine kinase [Sulfurivirga caldicuralii]|uniref:N-acetylglucosamine kinase n=1 Tax=Sulfurivirga caldicuralii TaxID=364032 RepID=A0A1N6E3W4_9GAMM|nr:ROK family protein [Sulfurivirga caldicuralii]SIN77720.1 N-acetylglucosamine kinase [Sulfurivirga caldicuralii]